MHHVVAALGERLDDGRHGGDADLEPGIERDVDLGHRTQAAIDVRVGADHLDVEAAHAAGADLLDGVGEPVHSADAVDHQRHARAVPVAASQLGLLTAEERRRGGIGDRGQAGVEQGQRATADVRRASLQIGNRHVHRRGQLALVHPAGPAIQIGVAQVTLLELMQQLVLVHLELHREEPGAQQRHRVARGEIGWAGWAGRMGWGGWAGSNSLPRVALPHHPLDDAQHGRGIKPPARPPARPVRRVAAAE